MAAGGPHIIPGEQEALDSFALCADESTCTPSIHRCVLLRHLPSSPSAIIHSGKEARMSPKGLGLREKLSYPTLIRGSGTALSFFFAL
jgi:hypothetical protein